MANEEHFLPKINPKTLVCEFDCCEFDCCCEVSEFVPDDVLWDGPVAGPKFRFIFSFINFIAILYFVLK
jgi:hypothetical protein